MGSDEGSLPHAIAESGGRGRIRVLSMDGGGIYGLTGAYWLRQLCEQDPKFLDPDCIHLFAGCSSGAINSLLLAMEESPREAVLSGRLEAFWKDPRVFENTSPTGKWTSMMGLTSWFHADDFLAVLSDYFGDRTLDDLKHTVQISAWNWTGDSRAARHAAPEPPKAPPGFEWMQPTISMWHAAATGQLRHQTAPWRPKFFQNLVDDDPDGAERLTDVAYWAATPPGFRPMRSGLGDGASFNANPAVPALALIVATSRRWDETRKHRKIAKDRLGQKPDAVQVLGRVALFSIGSGQRLPHYCLSNFDLSSSLFQNLPTNPLIGALASPTYYSLDAATEEAEFITRQLVGHRTYRLNPGVLNTPTVLAAWLARFPMARDALLQQIRAASCEPASAKAVEAGLKFLRSKDWGDDTN